MDEFLPAPKRRDQPLAVAKARADIPFSFTDISSVVGVLLRRWKLIAAMPVVMVTGAIIVLHMIAPQYRSTVSVLVVDPREPENGADTRRLSGLEVDAAAVATEIEVMQSKSLALKVAAAQELDKDPEFTRHGRLAAFLDAMGLGGSTTASASRGAATATDKVSPELDRAADELSRRLSVERVQFSYVLSASVMAGSPEKAQRLAAAIANTYLDDQRQARDEAMTKATTWLAGRLDELRSRAASYDAAIQKLKSENGLSDTGAGGNVSQQQISELNAQLAAARADADEKRLRYQQITRAASSNEGLQSIPEVMASSVIQQLKDQQTELSGRVTTLKNKYGDQHPDVITAKSQLDGVNRAIAAEVNRIIGDMKNAYDIAVARQHSVEQSLATLTAASSNAQALVQLQELQRMAAANSALYEGLFNQFNAVDQASSLHTSQARIISPATLPVDAAYPRRRLVLFLVTAASVVFGVAIAFLVEYLASGFKTSTQIEQCLGHPVLGMAPAIRGARRRSAVDRHDILKRLVNEPFSQLSETMRAVSMSVMLSDVDDVPKVMLVTSSVPGEGKSTIALLLAASGALSQQKTVVIDCDLRRKSLSEVFGLRNEPGLVEVLLNGRNAKEMIHHDASTNMSILPGGATVRNSAELFNSRGMHELIAQLRAEYDVVILDTSPLLPVIDTAVLARHCDKLLLVVEWNRTPRMAALQAIKRLQADAARFVGIVVNKVDYARLKSYGYGYGEGYHYGRHYRTLEKYYSTPDDGR